MNLCSFLIFYELESTDISTPQQLPARGRHVYSFLISAGTQLLVGDRSISVNVIRHTLVGLKCLTEAKYKNLYDHVDHTRFHIVEMGYQMVQLLSAHIVGPTSVRQFDPSLRLTFLQLPVLFDVCSCEILCTL